jgi:hypothetical protein
MHRCFLRGCQGRRIMVKHFMVKRFIVKHVMVKRFIFKRIWSGGVRGGARDGHIRGGGGGGRGLQHQGYEPPPWIQSTGAASCKATISREHSLLSSEAGTCKKVKAGFRPWLSGEIPSTPRLRAPLPLSSESGTCKTVTARFWTFRGLQHQGYAHKKQPHPPRTSIGP